MAINAARTSEYGRGSALKAAKCAVWLSLPKAQTVKFMVLLMARWRLPSSVSITVHGKQSVDKCLERILDAENTSNGI